MSNYIAFFVCMVWNREHLQNISICTTNQFINIKKTEELSYDEESFGRNCQWGHDLTDKFDEQLLI